jgi:hypothetical protein
MVQEHRAYDTIDQLKRRISFIDYHYIKDGEYKKLEVPMAEYQGYSALVSWSNGSIPYGFTEVTEEYEQLPFTETN